MERHELVEQFPAQRRQAIAAFRHQFDKTCLAQIVDDRSFDLPPSTALTLQVLGPQVVRTWRAVQLIVFPSGVVRFV